MKRFYTTTTFVLLAVTLLFQIYPAERTSMEFDGIVIYAMRYKITDVVGAVSFFISTGDLQGRLSAYLQPLSALAVCWRLGVLALAVGVACYSPRHWRRDRR